MAPKKLEKKLRKEEKVKKAITIEKKEIMQKYGVSVNYAQYTTLVYYEKFR
jgi:hypothetical protein